MGIAGPGTGAGGLLDQSLGCSHSRVPPVPQGHVLPLIWRTNHAICRSPRAAIIPSYAFSSVFSVPPKSKTGGWGLEGGRKVHRISQKACELGNQPEAFRIWKGGWLFFPPSTISPVWAVGLLSSYFVPDILDNLIPLETQDFFFNHLQGHRFWTCPRPQS